MLTIDLEPELESTLKTMAEQEHISVNEIINRLLGFSLREKQESPDKLNNANEKNRQLLLEKIRNIKPVKCEYSSEEIVRSLRDGTPLE